MSIMPSMLTSINQKIERRTLKSPTMSKLNREISIRKYIPRQINQKLQESTKRIFNDNEINLQISKQMKQIEDLLIQIKPQLQDIQRKNNERPIMQILFDLEEKIKRKDYLLTHISNQNKELKSANNKSLRYADSSNNDSQQLNPQKQEKTFKLAQQLKNERQELIKTKNLHLQKKEKLELIKNQVSKLQGEYVQKCKKTKEKPLTYEMFKCLNEEKKKQLNNEIQGYEGKRRKRQTLKQMLKSNSFHTTPTKNKTQKNLKEIVNRKKIAQQALKTARKKYNQQISEFYAKLQFLREQDLALVQTLKQKQVEFYTLENKFNESRRHLLGNRSPAHTQSQKFIDTLRFKSEDYDMDQTQKTKKIKYFSPQPV